MVRGRISGLIFQAAVVAAVAACDSGDVTNDPSGNTTTYPCAAKPCSAHALCVVAADLTASCVCEIGYHADGDSCVANVIGAECDGVTCNGHGSCVVVLGEPNYPLCRCDAGYQARGDTECAPDEGPCAGVLCSGHGTCTVLDGGVPWCDCDDGYVTTLDLTTDPPGARRCIAEVCASTADCGDGNVCGFESGACAPASGGVCGLPASGTGSGSLNSPCYFDGTRETCGAGFACAVYEWGMAADGLHYQAAKGLCRAACNPCAPSCGDGESCFSLDSGGGFCATALRMPDAPATDNTLCAGAGDRTIACHSPCAPEDATFPNAGGLHFGAADPSPDCGAGELCSLAKVSIDGDLFKCTPGVQAADGDRCDPANGIFCDFPYSCWPILGDTTYTYCTVACSTELPCAEGLSCAQDHCVRDGAVPVGAACTESRQCASGLTCSAGHCLP